MGASGLEICVLYLIPPYRHRAEHLNYDGLMPPKDDPWQDSCFPPNGWDCTCYTHAVTKGRLKKYQAEGILILPCGGGSTLRGRRWRLR
jgi:hypothetical protein